MNLENFRTLLLGSGLPVAYMYFKSETPPSMPFITYSQPATNNFTADGKVYVQIKHIEVTLWTEKRDETTENLLTDIFDENSIPWSRTEEFLEEDKCYEITYEVEV